MLLPFLAQDDARLDSWNVGIVEAGQGPVSREQLGMKQGIKMVNRARLADTNSFADIKALMSKRDVLFDCGDAPPEGQGWDHYKHAREVCVGEIPLLLLYPIDRNSSVQRPSNVRIGLGATFDVLGYGIVFPGSRTEGGDFVSVELRTLSADEIEAIAAEEAAQAEAAGVE